MMMKLYIVVVYGLTMCMKEDNPGLKYFKEQKKNVLSIYIVS